MEKKCYLILKTNLELHLHTKQQQLVKIVDKKLHQKIKVNNNKVLKTKFSKIQ